MLFQLTFVSLKIEGELTNKVERYEVIITGEVRIFQACVIPFNKIKALLWSKTTNCNRTIIDDNYQHSLQIFEDMTTHVLRLNASVWDGPRRYGPVWTAFSMLIE